jgi:hypothetical protein
MSDHEYSQGICGDGAAILKDGQPMTIVALTDGDHLGTALWFFPLLFIIGMGFFASRDKRYEHGKRGINHE